MKFQFCEQTVEFAGVTITPNGVVPSQKLLSAICEFPTPTDLTSARSWFGLVNQVAWAYAISPVMQPFRTLKPNQKFYWDEHLEILCETSKKVIINLVKRDVQAFDITRKTRIQSDWSKDGLGYLLQKYYKCSELTPMLRGWLETFFASSRFTKDAESRYAPTEGEALAVAWALQHSRLFTPGCEDLLVAIDHKPLLGIFNNRDLGSIKNPRIQTIK